MNGKEKKIALQLLTFGLVLNYIFDGINKISTLYFPAFSRTAILYRIFFELICILLIFIFLNKTRLQFFIIFLYFFISFFIGNFYLKYFIGIDIGIPAQFIYFNKYFFIFFIFYATYKTLKIKEHQLYLIQLFKKIFLFNGVLAILGILLKIKLFDSTPLGTPRFGYDGLILAQNEASIFYLLALFIFYYDWKQKKISSKLFFMVVILSFLTGMKAVIVGVLLLGIYHLFVTVNIKKLKYILLGSFFIPFLLIKYVSKIKVTFGYYYYFLMKHGFIFTFLGGRNTFIESRIVPLLKKWDLINYFIGGQNISNINDYFSLIEMDFIDLFLFFGIINAIFFFYLYKNIIIGEIKTKYYLFVISVFMLLAFFSGHFFTSSINSIYIIIVFPYLRQVSHE